MLYKCDMIMLADSKQSRASSCMRVRLCLNAVMDLIRSRISAAKTCFASSSLQSNPSREEFCIIALHCLSLFIVPPHPLASISTRSTHVSLFFFFPLRDRKYPREVDAWSEALLSQCPHHPGGEQEGPEERWAHTQRVGQDEAGPHTHTHTHTEAERI